MGKKLIVREGQRFGQLTVIEEAKQQGHRRCFRLKCDCGNICIAKLINLRLGKTRSCGCLAYANARKHGMSRTPEYTVWVTMMSRCHNASNKSYPDYGGRGIKVCARWKRPANFFADMGPRPSPKHEIARLDNNEDYKPGNVVWMDDARSQNLNRRKQKNGTSQYRGVDFSEGSWRARINDPGGNGVVRYIGKFDTEKEAALAYDAVARLHKGFILNFPTKEQKQ